MSWVRLALPAAALGICSSVAAEQAPANRIEEITVVSSRVDQALRDVPAAISVVEQSDIQLGRQRLGLDESLGRVPGVFAQNRYNFSRDLRLAIRGFGARANFGIRGIKIYIDDIPATSADGQSGVDDIDLASLSRMEVTRGPFSSLYGASAGGVLNLYSEDGVAPGFLQAGATVGEDGLRQYRLKAAGAGERLDYMISVSDLTYDGYRDLSRVEATQLNSKFRYRIDDRSDLTVVANMVDSPQADDSGAITAAMVRQDPTQAQPRNISSNAGEEVEQQRIGLVYRRELSDDIELRVRNYYVWRDFEAFLPIGTHIPFVADDGAVELDRLLYGGGFQLTFDTRLFGLTHRVMLGADIDVQRDDRQRYLNEAGVRGALSFDQSEEAESYGVFWRSELDLSDVVTLVVGARYDEVELSADDDFFANGDQSGELDFDEVSPMLGVVWDFTDDATFYANYGSSFETPTFTELGLPARELTASLGGFANVSAQEAQSLEAGARGTLLDDQLFWDVAVYRMEIDDEIVSVENIGNRTFFENADTQRRGVEVSTVFQFSEDWRLTGAYTYSHFEFDSFASSPANEGNDLPGLPRHQMFAELRYQPESGLYASLDVLYVDELYADNANSMKADSSVVANLRAGYRWQQARWEVMPFVGLNNLFDEDYFTEVRINGFGGRVFEPAPERNVYAGITVNFKHH